MACGVTDPVACITEAVTQVANGIGLSVLDSLAEAFNEAAEWAIKTMMASWLKLGSPDVDSAASPARWITEHLNFITLTVLILAVFVACIRTALTQRYQPMGELAKTLGHVIVVSTAGGFILNLGIQTGDILAAWLLEEADFQPNQTLGLLALNQPGIVFILAIIVIIVQIIQLGLMIIRNGMLIFLAGTLPLAAAAQNTEMGRQWYKKSIAWGLAFLLYKPAAALIYAGSIEMMNGDQDIGTQLSGIFMMILAIAALPALMRFLVPATASMSGGNAGAMAGALVGAAVATGAIVATGGAGAAAGAGGFAGGGAAAGPTGAATKTAGTAGPSTGGPGGPAGPGGASAPSGTGAPGADGGGGKDGGGKDGGSSPGGATDVVGTGGSDSGGGSAPSGSAPGGSSDLVGTGGTPDPASGSGPSGATPATSSTPPTASGPSGAETSPGQTPSGTPESPSTTSGPSSSPSGTSGNAPTSLGGRRPSVAQISEVLRGASEGAGKSDETTTGMVGTE